jgi:polygalacturonase
MGNGTADDTGAFSQAIAAAKAGGGTVFVPVGTYSVSHVTLPSNVHIHGESRTGSILRYNGVRAEVLDQAGTLVVSRSTTGAAISNLTLVGTGAPGRQVDEIVLGLQDAANVTVGDVTIQNAQGRGIFVFGTACTGGVYSDITIKNVYSLANGGYGVGFWFYAGPSHNIISNVTTDTTDAWGLALDAGSSSGPHAAVSDNVITNLTVVRAARKSGSGGITWQGAQRNTLDGFRITNTDAQASCAIMMEEDQSGTLANDNIFSHGTIGNVGRCAINLQSAGAGNTFSYIAVTNIGLVTAADLFELGGTPVNSGMGGPTADNTFDHITLTETSGSYHYGVSLDSTQVPILRNHFTNMGWANPSCDLVLIEGQNSPLSDANANTGLTQ